MPIQSARRPIPEFNIQWNSSTSKKQYDPLEDPHASYFFASNEVKSQLKAFKHALDFEPQGYRNKKLKQQLKDKIDFKLPDIRCIHQQYEKELKHKKLFFSDYQSHSGRSALKKNKNKKGGLSARKGQQRIGNSKSCKKNKKKTQQKQKPNQESPEQKHKENGQKENGKQPNQSKDIDDHNKQTQDTPQKQNMNEGGINDNNQKDQTMSKVQQA